MTDNTPHQEPEASEQARTHEQDLLDLIAAKADRKRAQFERLHGFEINNQQEEDQHDE